MRALVVASVLFVGAVVAVVWTQVGGPARVTRVTRTVRPQVTVIQSPAVTPLARRARGRAQTSTSGSPAASVTTPGTIRTVVLTQPRRVPVRARRPPKAHAPPRRRRAPAPAPVPAQTSTQPAYPEPAVKVVTPGGQPKLCTAGGVIGVNCPPPE
jgi:hypothetical protein